MVCGYIATPATCMMAIYYNNLWTIALCTMVQPVCTLSYNYIRVIMVIELTTCMC